MMEEKIASLFIGARSEDWVTFHTVAQRPWMMRIVEIFRSALSQMRDQKILNEDRLNITCVERTLHRNHVVSEFPKTLLQENVIRGELCRHHKITHVRDRAELLLVLDL